MNPVITDQPRIGDEPVVPKLPVAVAPKPPTEIPSANDNFEIAPGHSLLILGQMYCEKTVLPGWYVNLDGRLVACVIRGVVTKTSRPVTEKVSAPQPKTDTDPTPLMALELNRLREENEGLVAGNKMLVAQMTELKAQSDGRMRALAELTDKASHWQSVAEKSVEAITALETQVANLTADLEVATAPKAKTAKSSTPATAVKG